MTAGGSNANQINENYTYHLPSRMIKYISRNIMMGIAAYSPKLSHSQAIIKLTSLVPTSPSFDDNGVPISEEYHHQKACSLQVLRTSPCTGSCDLV